MDILQYALLFAVCLSIPIIFSIIFAILKKEFLSDMMLIVFVLVLFLWTLLRIYIYVR